MDHQKTYYEKDEYAGFLLRLVAYFIDGVLLSIVFFILVLVFMGPVIFELAQMGPDIESQMTPNMAIGLAGSYAKMLISVIVCGWLYYAVMESSKHQATVGKLALGLKVTDEFGDPIGFGRATGRYFGKILSSIIFAIGYLMIIFTEKKQGLHDMIAKTLVLRSFAQPLD